MKGVVFDLDETLVDRRGSLSAYARRLNEAFADATVAAGDLFVSEFHRLDGNGRVPRDEFFERLSAVLFKDVSAARIKEHFETTAWMQPFLFDRVPDLLDPFASVIGGSASSPTVAWRRSRPRSKTPDSPS